MPLTFEQFKALRDKRLSIQQITDFEAGKTPAGIQPQPDEPSLKSKVGGAALKGTAKVGEFLGLGPLGKGLGMVIRKFTPEYRALEKRIENKTATAADYAEFASLLEEVPSEKAIAGSALQTAALFAPGPKIGKVTGAKTALGAFGRGALKVAPRGAAIGAAFGAGAALEEDKGFKDIAKRTGIGAFTGGLFSAVFGGLAARKKFLAPAQAAKIKEKAIAQYKKGLQATKEKYKEKSEKIIPDLLDQKVWGTKKKLLQKANKNVALSLKEYEKLGELKGMVSVEGIIEKIDDEIIQKTLPSGRILSVHTGRVKALKDLRLDVLAMDAFDGVKDKLAYQEQLRGLAAAYGDELYQTRKAMKTITDSKTLSQVKKVDGAIRALLNTKNPEYAKINKVYHLNSELADILIETATRKEGHKVVSLLNGILGSTGFAGGLIAGAKGGAVGSVVGGITAGVTLPAIATLLNSTVWNTLRAVQKAKVADKLIKLSTTELPRIINILSAGGTKTVLEFIGD